MVDDLREDSKKEAGSQMEGRRQSSPFSFSMDSTFGTTSNGSPILAFGKARRSFRSYIGMTIIAIAVIFIGCLTFGLCSSTVVPAQTVFSIVLKPTDVIDRIGGARILDLPAPWRTAIETKKTSPVILGIAKNTDGSLHPFAMIRRPASITVSENLIFETKGFFHLLFSGDLETKKASSFSLVRESWSLKKHDATWLIRQDLLQELSGSSFDAEGSDVIRGTWDGANGEIHLVKTGASSLESSGALFATLGSNAEEAKPVVSALFSQGIDLSGSDQTPSSILVQEDGALFLGWMHPTPKDLSIARVAFRQVTSTVIELPDATIAEEFQSVSVGGVEIAPLFISASGVSNNLPSTSSTSDCDGVLRFRASGIVLQNILSSISVPVSWKQSIESIEIREGDDHANVCVK